MNKTILCFTLLLVAASCKKKDEETPEKWEETTKVSSPYLQKITLSSQGDTVVLFDFKVDANKDLTAVHIGNTGTIYDMVYDDFKKDKNGRVSMITYRLALSAEGLWMRFNYDQDDRIISIDNSSIPTVSLAYDAQDRLTGWSDKDRQMKYHYSGNNTMPDSSTLTHPSDPTVYTAVYTYGSGVAPVSTLPHWVALVDYGQAGFHHLWHDVTGIVNKKNGTVQSTYNYSSTYDAAGKLITRTDLSSGLVYTYHYAN